MFDPDAPTPPLKGLPPVDEVRRVTLSLLDTKFEGYEGGLNFDRPQRAASYAEALAHCEGVQAAAVPVYEGFRALYERLTVEGAGDDVLRILERCAEPLLTHFIALFSLRELHARAEAIEALTGPVDNA